MVDANAIIRKIMVCGTMKGTVPQEEVKDDEQITNEELVLNNRIATAHSYIHVDDMTDEEVGRSWYTNDDINRFRRAEKAARQLRKERIQRMSVQRKADAAVSYSDREDISTTSESSISSDKKVKWGMKGENKEDDSSELTDLTPKIQNGAAMVSDQKEYNQKLVDMKQDNNSSTNQQEIAKEASITSEGEIQEEEVNMAQIEAREKLKIDFGMEINQKIEEFKEEEKIASELDLDPIVEMGSVSSDECTREEDVGINPVQSNSSGTNFSFPSYPASYTEPSLGWDNYQLRLSQDFYHSDHKSSDLVDLRKEYQEFRTKLRKLVKSFQKYQTTMGQMEKARSTCFEECSTLIQPLSAESLHQENQPLSKLNKLAIDQQTSRALDFQKSVLDYAKKWEQFVTQTVEAELKEVKKMCQSKVHYEKKVETLRKKTTGMETKGKEVSEELDERLTRNEVKLKDACDIHESSATQLCAMIEQVTQYGYKDLYPLLENLMKWEFNRAGGEVSLYGKFPLMLDGFEKFFDKTKLKHEN